MATTVYNDGMNAMRPLRDLPNVHGYEFVGVLWDGSTQTCRVVKCDDGLHRIEGVAFRDLRGWTRLTEKPNQEKRCTQQI